MAKYTITIQDVEDSALPAVDIYKDGEEQEGTLARPVYVLIRMLFEILNSSYRSDVVNMIGEVHKQVQLERSLAQQSSELH